MRAVVITEHGGPEVLKVQERPDPPVGPGEVRIAVKASGINFADTLARSGTYPDAPKPAVRGRLRGRGRGRVGGRGRRGLQARRPRLRRHALRRPRRARLGAGEPGLPAAGGPQLRAGRRHPGQLRDRLRGARDHGRAQARGARADPRRRRRGGHLGDPGREGDRSRGLRHGVGLQARRDPRAGRRPRDRLPHAGLRGRGDAADERGGGGRRDRRDRPLELSQELPGAALRRPTGDVRGLGDLDRRDARPARRPQGPGADARGDDAVVEEPRRS